MRLPQKTSGQLADRELQMHDATVSWPGGRRRRMQEQRPKGEYAATLNQALDRRLHVRAPRSSSFPSTVSAMLRTAG